MRDSSQNESTYIQKQICLAINKHGYFEITASLGIRFKVFTWPEWGYHVLKCSILNTYYVLDTEEAQLLSGIIKKYQVL